MKSNSHVAALWNEVDILTTLPLNDNIIRYNYVSSFYFSLNKIKITIGERI